MSAVVTEKKLKVVGTRPDRPDGVPKLTGTAQYVSQFARAPEIHKPAPTGRAAATAAAHDDAEAGE